MGRSTSHFGLISGINTPTQPQVNKNNCGNSGAIRNDQGICVCQGYSTYDVNEGICVSGPGWVRGPRTEAERDLAARQLATRFGRIDMLTGQRIS